MIQAPNQNLHSLSAPQIACGFMLWKGLYHNTILVPLIELCQIIKKVTSQKNFNLQTCVA